MLKQVKRNKRLDWRICRYSKPFKARTAIRLARCGAILTQGASMMSAIASTSARGNGFVEAEKDIAMLGVAIESFKAFVNALKEQPK